MYKFFQAFILLGLLTACAHNAIIQTLSPQISLADFRIAKMGLLEQNYRIRLRIKNPNSFPLPIMGMTYQLHLNDQEFAKGANKQSLTIPALGENFLDIEVTSNLMRTIGEWSDWAKVFKRHFNYRLSGSVNIMEGAPSIPFEYQGKIPLGRL
jgi:LEA14-like dessication related protein